ncbi:hypothetical protein N782_21885 [Pontibacillus yanchengensis Y32]|uniref:Uncharacterized protein n=1 Tax=Pontibacillus yanchengensis Y32 TaxID=1385514 RepID=A0A0A2T6E3_9BACI|nr:hypothetical protein N782_21885 [Pontibacillus yanchengensis Y32]
MKNEVKPQEGRKWVNSFIRRLLFYGQAIVFFIIYYKIIVELYEEFVPYTYKTDFLSLLFFLFVVPPLSLVTTHFYFRLVKSLY